MHEEEVTMTNSLTLSQGDQVILFRLAISFRKTILIFSLSQNIMFSLLSRSVNIVIGFHRAKAGS